MLKKLTTLACVLMLCMSCAALQTKTTLTTEYVAADVQFEATLGLRIETWIANDTDLTSTEKQALALALQAWRTMVKVAAEAEGVPHSIEIKN